MKKLILLFLSVIVCVTMQGQTHMKFMGIPLDGTVESFSQKLKAKGINYDAVASKKLSPGAKLYRGTFMGEKAQFVVMFNAKNRIQRTELCTELELNFRIQQWNWRRLLSLILQTNFTKSILLLNLLQ